MPLYESSIFDLDWLESSIILNSISNWDSSSIDNVDKSYKLRRAFSISFWEYTTIFSPPVSAEISAIWPDLYEESLSRYVIEWIGIPFIFEIWMKCVTY